MYMNHEHFSANFRYALKHVNSFQIYCHTSIWFEQGRNTLPESW